MFLELKRLGSKEPLTLNIAKIVLYEPSNKGTVLQLVGNHTLVVENSYGSIQRAIDEAKGIINVEAEYGDEEDD